MTVDANFFGTQVSKHGIGSSAWRMFPNIAKIVATNDVRIDSTNPVRIPRSIVKTVGVKPLYRLFHWGSSLFIAGHAWRVIRFFDGFFCRASYPPRGIFIVENPAKSCGLSVGLCGITQERVFCLVLLGLAL